MVIQTPTMRKKIVKLKCELMLLMLKEKIMGTLSEADQKRVREIRLALAIKY